MPKRSAEAKKQRKLNRKRRDKLWKEHDAQSATSVESVVDEVPSKFTEYVCLRCAKLFGAVTPPTFCPYCGLTIAAQSN